MNKSCGGTLFTESSSSSSSIFSEVEGASLELDAGEEERSSFSTAKSHWTIWSSAPEEAKTEESVGCHSTEVMAEEWCLNVATGEGDLDWEKRKETMKR